ncbi:extracellular calcium-sensing receptor-like [Ambystoma mexicanum]|uniref:extracellular calcium-sensing receptor-like n=1 Tax=Ambystoma mexicanum TaxID=8296 RepID=UPI0037E91239
MAFAVEEINRNTSLLPNITLGFQIHDACLSEALAVACSMSLISGAEEPVPKYRCPPSAMIPGAVGEVSSTITGILANILGVYKVPQVSYGATLATFSNKNLYPSFLRTAPADPMGAYAIASLLRHLGWTWVGVLCSDSDSGILGSELLKEAVTKMGGCIAFSEKVSIQHSKERAKYLVDLIERSTANVIVTYCHVSFMVPIFEMLAQRKVSGKVWLGATTFIITPDLFTKPAWTWLNGTMSLAFHDASIPGFKEFVHSIHPRSFPGDIFMKSFWEKAFGCKWHIVNDSWGQGDETVAKFCTGKEEVVTLDPTLFDLDNLRYTYNVYLAVYAFAHALHDLMECLPQVKQSSGKPCVSIDKLQSQQVQ